MKKVLMTIGFVGMLGIASMAQQTNPQQQQSDTARNSAGQSSDIRRDGQSDSTKSDQNTTQQNDKSTQDQSATQGSDATKDKSRKKDKKDNSGNP